jgi:coenzyme F420-0:L-glutamate ligase/coenzyme F420-1:gamma-L-glutamate ligase
MIPRLDIWGLPGIPEVQAGDDLAALVGDAILSVAADDPSLAPRDGDIVVVTSKVVSKAEGRQIPAEDRQRAIADDTVRVVAERPTPNGMTRIVENRQGLVLAAAGVDTSNVPEGQALRLPEDPDRSARALCAALRLRFGVTLGLIITDTLGRPWRIGQTDIAIGAAGVTVVDDFRGRTDANGHPLAVTVTVLADEIAAAAELVKGKTRRIPAAMIRGLAHVVCDLDAPGARSLVRRSEDDMFRLGSDEAFRLGYEAAMNERLARRGNG